jgi:hypothetical protein
MATFIRIDTGAAAILAAVGVLLTAMLVAPDAVEGLLSGIWAGITGAY